MRNKRNRLSAEGLQYAQKPREGCTYPMKLRAAMVMKGRRRNRGRSNLRQRVTTRAPAYAVPTTSAYVHSDCDGHSAQVVVTSLTLVLELDVRRGAQCAPTLSFAHILYASPYSCCSEAAQCVDSFIRADDLPIPRQAGGTTAMFLLELFQCVNNA